MAFVPLTADERQAMLEQIGVGSVADLFADIPASVRFPQLDVPPPLTEIQTVAKMSALAAKNQPVGQLACFVGAGYYNHYSPSVVSHLMGRSEFYTSYTPYQPEVSQGTLQYSFEFQSLVCDLFEMDVANSSVYDGASGAAEAVLMALRISRRDRVVLDGSVHPEHRAVVAAYLDGRGIEVVTTNVGIKDGKLNRQSVVEQIDGETACVVIQQPDFFGTIRDLAAIVAKAREVGALVVYVVGDPVSLGLLKTPGGWDADIAIGEGQGLGLPLQYGGPGVGIMTCKTAHLRQLPGRIVGQTTDHDGRRGFVLTLQAREQHIRREKATSNICTSQTLLALGATIYLAAMGPAGLKQAAGLSHKQTRAVADQIRRVDGYRVVNDGPFFDEITVTCPADGDTMRHELAKRGIIGGYALGREYPGLENALVLCATEMTTSEEIDRLVSGLREIGGAR
ncbi:MAG: aminomethyl-transferring glycine dehydrogenase subunit GcvPA [Chloroflexi bacterium]|nr:aminomethyl-transferring glycine dehydrogenase subunit GcvPA [Chloroflexota bacterium]